MKVRITAATTEYDHTRDLVTGNVQVAGAEVIWLQLEAEEIFHRFVSHREWDVSEMSMSQYTAMRGAGDMSLTAIPVFLCRSFRHSAMWVRAGSDIVTPTDLACRKVGVPEWTQTACLYLRGMLANDYGVDLASIDWYQAGVNEAGRRDHVKVTLPPGFRYSPTPNRSLNEMLLDGTLDAVLSARPPHASAPNDGRVVPLIADSEPVERDYYRRTGIFPIMHAVVIRSELIAEYPWLAMNLYQAFAVARDRSVARIAAIGGSPLPVPWMRQHALAAWRDMGGDPWPYGIEPNRSTLEAFLLYAHQQGLTPDLMKPEEIFAPQVDAGYRV